VSVLELGEGVFEVKSTAATTTSAATTSTRRSSTGWSRVQARPGHRPRRGQDGAPAAVRGGGEGEDRAVVHDDDADQPAVHHGDAEGPKHLDLQLTRAKLEEITADLLERTVGPTKQALSDAGSTPRRSTTSCSSAA
jgi:molecular chaperone DnaK